MSCMGVPRSLVEDALFVSVDDPEWALRDDYCGRGAYGDQCFGIVGGVADLMDFTVAMTKLEMERGGETPIVDSLKRSVHVGDMGLNVIYYFPGHQLTEE